MLRLLSTFLWLAGSELPAPAAAAAKSIASIAAKPILRTALVREVDIEFAAADLNKDGYADRGELEVAEANSLKARRAAVLRDRELAFRRLDLNRDGQLTLQEFNAVVGGAPLPKADAAPTLAKFDNNKDGKISAAENRAIILSQFDALDRDKNGVLHPSEQQVRR